MQYLEKHRFMLLRLKQDMFAGVSVATYNTTQR